MCKWNIGDTGYLKEPYLGYRHFEVIDFVDVFEEAEKSRINDIWDISFDFGCYSDRYGSVPHLVFHRGSEAWLDTYTTLAHMDIMIRKVL